ncbi:hypothetical protein [Herbidospora sp. NBRC 101105]|uniref:hypothetical protein n=1 Tax=Herbidospora sp. NBRC 101105 TaxID=3032195 RepID=UPI0024A08929|nr:hypothetical protein [Herbidospora sp. NBRC 101105]GLX95443.1 hypothetical protein Hesp01_33930 [Herbidospora sp. NBRC 101105]
MSTGKFPGKHPETELSPADDPGKVPMGEHKPPPPESTTPKEATHHGSHHTASQGAADNTATPTVDVNLWNATATHHNAPATPHHPATERGEGSGHGHGQPYFGPQSEAHPGGGRSQLDEVQTTYVPGLDPPHSVNSSPKPSPAEPHGGLRPEDSTTSTPADADHQSGTGHQGSPVAPLPGTDFGGQDPGADTGGHQHGTPPGTDFGGQDHDTLPGTDNGGHQHGTLPGTDFGGQDHDTLPGTDFGGQNPSELPSSDHSGPGMDHAFAQAEMGPPPGIA